jgi:hypothetical protein
LKRNVDGFGAREPRLELLVVGQERIVACLVGRELLLKVSEELPEVADL